MTVPDNPLSLGTRLLRAREFSGFTQDDVAANLGVSRAMVSYWEGDRRRPNDAQLAALAKLYGRSLDELLGNGALREPGSEAAMLYRRADIELSPAAKRGIDGFLKFLESYATLAEATGVRIRGMKQSPFGMAAGFDSHDDARRKAEEVRAHLRMGLGPIIDVDRVCALLGVTVFRAALGSDLTRTISGAFYRHAAVGFAVLVNTDMTPGRRRFTLAHELAHALLHSDHDAIVVSGPKRDNRERFADVFAGEFLMPSEGVRRAIEELGAGPKVEDPADVIHLQRFFNVSYITALVRLRQARLLSQANFESFKLARPVAFAEHLGYAVDEEEYQQDPNRWRIDRYPASFLRLVRLALKKGAASAPTLAGVMDLTVEEVEELADDGVVESDTRNTELHEYEVTGVLG